MLITPQAGYEPEMLRLWSVFCEKQARDFFRFGFTFFLFPRQKQKVHVPHFRCHKPENLGV